MGTPQNQSPSPSPSPKPHQNQSILPHSNATGNPNPNLDRSILPHSNPTLNPNPTLPAPGLTSPSFEEVSKLFTLPLSAAADSLGICPSILRKVCYENGLVRWPYRKFLSGKSIEEIKKDAELKVAGERNVSFASSAVSSSPSLPPQRQSTNSGPLHGGPTLRTLTPPPTIDNRSISSHMNDSTVSKANPPAPDEFKYGFPSGGLSATSHRWWGTKSADENVVDTKRGGERQPKDLEKNTAADDLSLTDEEVTEVKKKHETTDADPDWASSLSALRRKMANDGRQALRHGVYRGYNVKTLGRAKKDALIQIFKSYLPEEWGDMSTER